MNLANKLTIVRIFLVPIFLIFITVQDIPYGTIIATVIFIIAALTDKLDGYIARSRNQITKFGKFMDPLADKLLVTAALISLVEYQIVPAWAAIVIIAREFAVTGLRTIAASDGNVIAASYWGKLKTVIQIIAIILLLLKVNIAAQPELTDKVYNSNLLKGFFNWAPEIFLYLAVIITIISGLDYFIKNKSAISIDK
ncbi:CDP-diacylglycerol--glycerol-3-phosphate 3-phosphatidyltransferase [Clostridium algidicarnis]|uniref:CDP-diacylglycerol--glycerol-3-phosphate 3-phosphatidyltransferase n=2 Tax=Clostridium algidicarnis TaxID=37659 RepID=A0A2S6FY32_9CLOT|nr:CDP-diacylglycerol--glycerol-3-phosphate 3-phosphatidyltransferase [Clostridium algidicarnis]MBU3195379.1 CDP-diacylglycerol--glycerol-3-phosphate 3-phosphatidyltransferase [Clostridium algidicarnis]MBU3208338.1 CDP-diacylglycerol--glycerol-3-phosphate 3-phosphatidyltransferase [Clostridium algidicarnis]MBU3220109.1 CDP-diacylglycerol--glycerol-3-phosphate 3-phosphatidyltransferase [Clostridium algidicarnis]MBU3227430.1 CDP-diacylglycerol--glycerol-3-phosphate 3-phosphatidyltransferase [Clos